MVVEYATKEDYKACYYCAALVCGVCGWVDWSFVRIGWEFGLEEVVDGWLGDCLDFGLVSRWRRGVHRL